MLTIQHTTQFKKDRKLAIKRGLPIHLLDSVLQALSEEKTLDPKYKDHALVGTYTGLRECHILPDWLLIYAIDKDS